MRYPVIPILVGNLTRTESYGIYCELCGAHESILSSTPEQAVSAFTKLGWVRETTHLFALVECPTCAHETENPALPDARI